MNNKQSAIKTAHPGHIGAVQMLLEQPNNSRRQAAVGRYFHLDETAREIHCKFGEPMPMRSIGGDDSKFIEFTSEFIMPYLCDAEVGDEIAIAELLVEKFL